MGECNVGDRVMARAQSSSNVPSDQGGLLLLLLPLLLLLLLLPQMLPLDGWRPWQCLQPQRWVVQFQHNPARALFADPGGFGKTCASISGWKVR